MKNKHILEELTLAVEFDGSFSNIITKSSTACLLELQRSKYRFKELKHNFILCFSLKALRQLVWRLLLRQKKCFRL